MNKFILLFIFLFIYSCSYPDIDTVPKFNINITNEENLIICKFNNKFKESSINIYKNFFEIRKYNLDKGTNTYVRIANSTTFDIIGKEDCFKEIRYLINRL